MNESENIAQRFLEMVRAKVEIGVGISSIAVSADRGESLYFEFEDGESLMYDPYKIPDGR
jgi:hypothetical protein